MRLKKVISKWFDVPDDPDGAKIQFKLLTPGRETEIRDESAGLEFIMDPGGNPANTKQSIKPKPKLANDLKIKESIVDWKDCYDENGNLMACNSKNKLRVINEVPGFTDF